MAPCVITHRATPLCLRPGEETSPDSSHLSRSLSLHSRELKCPSCRRGQRRRLSHGRVPARVHGGRPHRSQSPGVQTRVLLQRGAARRHRGAAEERRRSLQDAAEG